MTETPVAAKSLNLKNTAIKFALDQTIGAAFNITLFVASIGILKGLSYDQIVEALRKVWKLYFIQAAFDFDFAHGSVLRIRGQCMRPVQRFGQRLPSSALRLCRWSAGSSLALWWASLGECFSV